MTGGMSPPQRMCTLFSFSPQKYAVCKVWQRIPIGTTWRVVLAAPFYALLKLTLHDALRKYGIEYHRPLKRLSRRKKRT